MADPKSCSLCDNSGAAINPNPLRHLILEVECPTCGTYAIDIVTDRAVREAPWREQRYRMSAVAREASLRGRKLLLHCKDGHVDVPGFDSSNIKEVVESRFPRTLDERLDRALLNLSHSSTHLGQGLDIDGKKDLPLVFAMNHDEQRFILDTLHKGGYLDSFGKRLTWTSEGLLGCFLSPAGWNRVADLTSGRVGERVTQAFVAMWFGNEKNQVAGRSSAEFCTAAFLSGFKPGIDNAGYSALRIDFKEFNDDVMDEIIAGIRRSKFIVADFTGHRAGVYYEAGFARGLGIPVIFTCHKDHVESAHFDTSHMNHLTWCEFDELAHKLEQRIVATIGQGPASKAASE